MLRSLLAGLVALPGMLSAQEPVPTLVRDALDLRIRLECREPITVERVSIRYWPAARFFVGRCEAYYGMPQTAVVALDSSGVFYLLDSPTSFELLERRIGVPHVDSADRIDYALHVAKLADAIPWDATLQAGGEPDPDPRGLAPASRPRAAARRFALRGSASGRASGRSALTQRPTGGWVTSH